MLGGKDLANVSKLLRKRTTPWEQQLWYYLRGGRFYGLKFKRQVPMGEYVVDFCCQTKRLVVELDGGQHNEAKISKKDAKKQKFLEDNSYKTLRFWNNEVENNIQGVLESIRREIFKT